MPDDASHRIISDPCGESKSHFTNTSPRLSISLALPILFGIDILSHLRSGRHNSSAWNPFERRKQQLPRHGEVRRKFCAISAYGPARQMPELMRLNLDWKRQALFIEVVPIRGSRLLINI